MNSINTLIKESSRVTVRDAAQERACKSEDLSETADEKCISICCFLTRGTYTDPSF